MAIIMYISQYLYLLSLAQNNTNSLLVDEMCKLYTSINLEGFFYSIRKMSKKNEIFYFFSEYEKLRSVAHRKQEQSISQEYELKSAVTC